MAFSSLADRWRVCLRDVLPIGWNRRSKNRLFPQRFRSPRQAPTRMPKALWIDPLTAEKMHENRLKNMHFRRVGAIMEYWKIPLSQNLESSRVHGRIPVSYTHLRAHETDSYLVCRLLL